MKLDKVIAERPNKKIYRDGDVCVKVFNSDYSKSDVLNEALNQARIEETGLPTPKIIEVTKIEGNWAIVSEFIEGKILTDYIAENPAKIDEYLEKLVDVQLMIQSKTCPLLTNLTDKMIRKISMADLDGTVKYELHTRLEGMPKHNKICHGDLRPSNIILKDNGEVYILDWAHVTQGNGSGDAARTYLTFCLKGERENADKYLNIFSRKSETEKRFIQDWLPIVAASQTLKGNEKEKELLNAWLNVVDYV